MEVRTEGPTGRVVDLAGMGPGNIVYVVEVKVSKADFARDNHTVEDTTAMVSRAASINQQTLLAQRILVQSTKDAQQPVPESWRRVPAFQQALCDYRKQVRKKRAYLSRLATYSTKFHDPRFLRIADYHYIIAPPGVVSPRDLPPQWGLLDDTPAVVIPAPHKKIRKTQGIAANILRAIARSNTNSMMRSQGVSFNADDVSFLETSQAGNRL